MSRTKPHPCEGLPAAARRAFDEVASGSDRPKASAKTMDTLVVGGFVERIVRLVHFGDGLPPLQQIGYAVPLNLHIAWCEHWASPKTRAGGKRRGRSDSNQTPDLFD
ncbi:MAG: hypothetical protein QHD01_16995 [Bradyrhizobium sp.]|uniref:hypothetical protein n=1 Tax=Bradyrhizobium sp. TaxID=376 RepID=UPI0029BF58CE|nr:hypothetical protein [Bradyrhizobium sp.]MDX3968279.1 hypothetical protein [Bradyrhizobium sp.]